MIIKVFIGLLVIFLSVFFMMENNIFESTAPETILQTPTDNFESLVINKLPSSVEKTRNIEHDKVDEGMSEVGGSLGELKEVQREKITKAVINLDSNKDKKSTQKLELLASKVLIVDMIDKYESVNTDRELRKVQREKMVAELTTYNKLVLPVALEKMKEK